MDPIAQIKDRLNIVDVISPYVTLRKRGTNWFGLCPFHSEKSGSFSVNEDRGFYHCFGCGESGDIFTFIEKYEHTDFRGALEILAKQANVDISNANFDNKYNEKKAKLIEINEVARKFYTWILKEHKLGERGRHYIEKRKITDKSIEKFGLGYAPIGYDNLYGILKKRGYDDQDILDAGVCVRRERDGVLIDKFRGRLMFPIENIAGNTVGFSGRYIPVPNPNPKFEPPKYLNTGETTIFNKGKIFYGFNQAKDEIVKKGFVIVSEGQINIISSNQVGEENIVASMGTALTPDHLKLMSRYTKNIYFCFDNDTAGKKAAVRSTKIALSMDLSVRIISLREGSDPDEEIGKDPDLWHGDIGLAKEAFDHFIDDAMKSYKSIDDKNTLLSDFVEIYASCVNPVTKDVLLQKLSTSFDVPYETLVEYFSQKSVHAQIVDLKKQETIIPSEALSSKGSEEYTLALLLQNYNLLEPSINIDHAKYFRQYSTLFEQTAKNGLDKVLEDEEYKKTVEELLTKSIPLSEEAENAYKDCINSLKITYIKSKVNSLKEELSFADERKQEQILKEIDQLINLLKK